jgi:adenylate kinase family enzyme
VPVTLAHVATGALICRSVLVADDLDRLSSERANAPCSLEAVRCHDGAVVAAQLFVADRIVVIGCAGSGKSTLAAALVTRLGAPHVRRDCLGLEGSDQYRRAVAEVVSGDRWVFDGAPYYVEELVYERAGLVVGFDLSRRVVMRRVITRSLRESLGRVPAPPHRDTRWRAWLNREHPVRWAWFTWADRHHELADLIDQALAKRASIVSLSTRRGVTAWLDQRSDAGWSVLRPPGPEPGVEPPEPAR